MNKIICHLTHNDLDALGCMLNLNYAHQDFSIQTYHTNYKNIEYVVSDTIEYCNKHNPKFLLISDVSFSQHRDLLEQILNKVSCEVIYLDHHVYPQNFFDNLNMTYIHDITKSASQIVHDYFNVNSGILNVLTKLIDVYDLWQVNDIVFNKSMELNEYFWTVDIDWLYLEIVNNDYKLPHNYTSTVQNIMKNVEDTINKYYDKNLIHSNGITTIVFADEYFNQVLLKEFKRGIKFVIIANSYGIVRIRFNQYSDISEETKNAIKMDIIGDVNTGHLNAFTFKLDNISFENLMNEIKKITGIIDSHL